MNALPLAAVASAPLSLLTGKLYRHAIGLGLVELPPEPHPDRQILVLCGHLRLQQDEWQRLYRLTSDDPECHTPADFEWEAYSNDVWPGVMASGRSREFPEADPPRQLITLRATTPEGRRAKAAAVAAIQEAALYCDCRDDSIELMVSALNDCAAESLMALGEKAQ